MERKLLWDLNERLTQAQRALAEYLPPNSGKTPRDTLNELLVILDNGEIHELQERIPEKPALFVVSS
jgi:hypothetical protein